MISNSENRIDAILGSLDGIKRAEAKPFMFTRVMAILQHDDKTIWGRTVSFIARPAVALLCLAIVIAANAYFVANNESANNEQAVTNTTSVSEQFLQNDNLLLSVNDLETGE
jgi:hypothetical protein